MNSTLSNFDGLGVDLHRAYLESTVPAVFLLLFIGALLMFLAGGVSASWDGSFSAVQVAFLVGMLVALIVFLLVCAAAVLTFVAIDRRHRHGMEIERALYLPSEPEDLDLEEPPPESTGMNLSVLSSPTVNQLNEDFRSALLIAEATLRELGKVRDGERLTEKPFSWEKCREARLVSQWSQWKRLLVLLESAGCGDNLRSKARWTFKVSNVHHAAERLRDYYINVYGLMEVNGQWTRK